MPVQNEVEKMLEAGESRDRARRLGPTLKNMGLSQRPRSQTVPQGTREAKRRKRDKAKAAAAAAHTKRYGG